jgi:glycosyltransferase involved in cell wall biosynthesis
MNQSNPYLQFAPFKIIVEGWRFVPHSYSVVNQWQLLAFLKRPEMHVRVIDRPYYRANWQPTSGLFDPPDEALVAGIGSPGPDFRPDVTFRVIFPYDFTINPDGITAVFGTSEYQAVTRSFLATPELVQRACGDPKFLMITPSRWSAAGFEALGLHKAQIVIVSHGVNTDVFRPDPETREAVRKRRGLVGFTFMNTGAMTENKGIDLLLRAFAAVAELDPHVHLMLKGTDALYPSRTLVEQKLRELSSRQAHLIYDKVIYTGSSLSMRQMARIYCAADAYVSPYRAEGFNMPVLEAMACGLPVICTQGGPTDDFVISGSARTIESQIVPVSLEGFGGRMLQPNLDGLIELMRRVAKDQAWRATAATDGPKHIAAGYTWDHIADQLTTIFLQTLLRQ